MDGSVAGLESEWMDGGDGRMGGWMGGVAGWIGWRGGSTGGCNG